MKTDWSNRLIDVGVEVPEMLLPAKGTDLSKWSVVACDQYTSQPEYWTRVEELVDSSPSTLKLTLPEVYLEEENAEIRIGKINRTMEDYVRENILIPQKPGFMYIERKTPDSPLRKGLMMAVDLERYDYNKGSRSLIRATEGTVLERIPPRVKIRENALIELPHIMLLIDDPGRSVIEPLGEMTEHFEKAYDFELMMDGGHIRGYKVEDEDVIGRIALALGQLADPSAFASRYSVGQDQGVLLFAVGDGNHSLASAKAHWENVKRGLSGAMAAVHPARHALVEAVNVHNEGLVFEPIHRVVFGMDPGGILAEMKAFFAGVLLKAFSSKEDMEKEAARLRSEKDVHVLPYIMKSGFGLAVVESPPFNLEVGTLQSFLDNLARKYPGAKVDYIHGEDVVSALGAKEGNLGFFLPAMNKHDLFKTVILDGALPRKTFSMGEAYEKRYYLECRKIK